MYIIFTFPGIDRTYQSLKHIDYGFKLINLTRDVYIDENFTTDCTAFYIKLIADLIKQDKDIMVDFDRILIYNINKMKEKGLLKSKAYPNYKAELIIVAPDRKVKKEWIEAIEDLHNQGELSDRWYNYTINYYDELIDYVEKDEKCQKVILNKAPKYYSMGYILNTMIKLKNNDKGLVCHV